jgi:hypothetical protein
MTAATATKMAGRVAQIGRPLRLCWRAPKKISSLPDRSIWTGKTSTKATRIASNRGASWNRLPDDRARRNPAPMPRKLASRTKVREVGEVEDLGASPADQRELEEEHQEAQKEEADAPR